MADTLSKYAFKNCNLSLYKLCVCAGTVTARNFLTLCWLEISFQFFPVFSLFWAFFSFVCSQLARHFCAVSKNSFHLSSFAIHSYTHAHIGRRKSWKIWKMFRTSPHKPSSPPATLLRFFHFFHWQ